MKRSGRLTLVSDVWSTAAGAELVFAGCRSLIPTDAPCRRTTIRSPGHDVEALMKAERGTFARLLPQVRADVFALLDVLWAYPPYHLLNKSRELEALDQYFCENLVDALMSAEAPYRDFFFHDLTAAFAIPFGIYSLPNIKTFTVSPQWSLHTFLPETPAGRKSWDSFSACAFTG